MSEMCEFYRDGKCRDADEGEMPCHFGGAWQDCEWGMPADPGDEGAGEAEQAEEPAAASAKAEKPCEQLKGLCEKTGCSFAGEEKNCPKYWPEGRLKIVYINVDLIDPRPGNRDIGDVTELADSIKTEGMHTPMTVVPHIDGIEGRYTNVAGHRRLAAAKLAGLEEVPCIIRELGKADRIAMMITENTQRKGLTPIEEAEALQQLRLELPGGTVAAVAARTGISETTVRRRMKLAELDSEKAKAAEDRGVTLKDYEKLYELKDPVRRDKALESLGTKEFDRVFQLQKNAEEDEAALARLVKSLEKKGAVRISEADRCKRKDLSNIQTVYSWNLKSSSINRLERDEEYVYTVEDRKIRVYQVVKKSETEDPEQAQPSDADLARAELQTKTDEFQDTMTGYEMELQQMDQDFLNLREEFVSGFDTFERNREEIMEVAVRALIGCNYWSESRLEELGNWLGVADVTDPMELGRVIRANPEKALLYTACCVLEKDAYTGWHETNYFQGARYRKYRRNERMDRLYECLRLLGYQWSTDEQRASAGALHQYDQMQSAIEQYKREKAELEKRIKV